MYTTFFGLEEKPFSITPDPHFLFLSERHAEALAHLVYGVTESGGFIQLTGEVGTGKTTLTRCLLDRLPDTVDLAVVLNPRLSVGEFLETIFDELHVDKPEGDPSTKDLVDALNRHLLESHAAGRRTVLLVDEAQNLDSDVLEQLRLLTNLETSKEKLLQIILVGQPELRRTLARNDLRQLAQRITGRYHLQTLTAEETIAYVQHRLRVAGAKDEVFTPGALWEIHRLSGGVPRLINVVCDRALLGAYSAESTRVDRRFVRDAAAEVSGEPQKETKSYGHFAKAAMAATVLLTLGVAAWGLTRLMLPDTETEAQTAPEQPAQLALATMPGGKTTALSLDANVAALADAPPVAKPRPREADLERLLSDPAVDSSTDTAFRELFGIWNARAFGDNIPPCRHARRQGLKCEFQVGSWRLLRTMNRPAILSLVDTNGQLHNAVITRVDDDDAVLRFGDVEFSVTSNDIAKFWYGEFLLLWRPEGGARDLLLPGTSSAGVRWLRENLSSLQGIRNDPADPEYYDNGLRRQVRAFQRGVQLEADGKAGVQTLIVLKTALNDPATPTLERN